MCKAIELQSFVWTNCGPQETPVFVGPMDIHRPMGTWVATDWLSAVVHHIFGCFLYLSHVHGFVHVQY